MAFTKLTSSVERVDRLLLPLSTNSRIGVAEDTAGPYSMHRCLSGVPPLLLSMAPPTQQPARQSANTDGKMLRKRLCSRMLYHHRLMSAFTAAPDVLLGRPPRLWTPDAWKQGHLALSSQRSRQSWRDHGDDDRDDGSDDEDDGPRPVLIQQPRRRFGIFCTSKSGSRRPGSLRR